jgi:hypothetical protein
VKRSRNPLIVAVAIAMLSGPAAAVAATSEDPEPGAPVEFTSKVAYDWQPSRGVTETRTDGSSMVAGEAWQFRVIETSDPRVDGTMTITLTIETYPGGEPTVHAEAYRIENEGGAWQEVPVFHLLLPWGADEFAIGAVSQHVYVGEDGYEGWTVLAEHTWVGEGFDVRGYIVEGELPIAPEPWSAE